MPEFHHHLITNQIISHISIEKKRDGHFYPEIILTSGKKFYYCMGRLKDRDISIIGRILAGDLDGLMDLCENISFKKVDSRKKMLYLLFARNNSDMLEFIFKYICKYKIPFCDQGPFGKCIFFVNCLFVSNRTLRLILLDDDGRIRYDLTEIFKGLTTYFLVSEEEGYVPCLVNKQWLENNCPDKELYNFIWSEINYLIDSGHIFC